jgi:two-component system LytT family sensor kinase
VATVGTVATFGSVPLRGVRAVGVLVTLWVGTAVLYPRLRDLAAWFVDTVVLRRPDYRVVERQLAAALQDEEDIPRMLDRVCAALAPALSAEVVAWRQVDPSVPYDIEGGDSAHAMWRGSAAAVLVPVTEAPRYVIHASSLTGGRRLLSDDHAALAAIAAWLARRIDAVRITGERHERELRERAIAQLATEAELRALRAQVNPHFLFNALTTIGYLIQTTPPRALETLMRLTELLRAVLRSEGEFTTLGRELALIEAYLEIEHARFEQRLRVRIVVSEELQALPIPSLLLQPLVENAVKHGIAPERAGGEVSIECGLLESEGQTILQIIVRDTGSGATADSLYRGRRRGVGLRNVQKRLACHYGDRASLSVMSVPGEWTTVAVRLPLEQPAAATVPVQVLR